MKPILIIAIVALITNNIHAQNAPGPGRAPQKQVVAVGNVIEAKDVESHRYTGLIVSPSIVHVVARVSGEILEIGFKDGDYVKKGQMLYRLDPIRYQAAVKSVEAKIAECKARIDYAQRKFDRNSSLYERRVNSKDSMENTLSELNVYKASILAAEAELITAKDDLKNTTIIAPMDGAIGVTSYAVGNYITPSSGVLVSIIQTDPLRVRFSISNRDFLSMFGTLENLRKNGRVRLRLADNSYYVQEGIIELMNNEANKNTDTIQIYALFYNPEKKLIPGSTVTVILSRSKGLILPAVLPSAVMHDSNGSYVYIVDDKNKIEKRSVVLGNSNPDLQMIITGVKVGEKIVIDGTHKTMAGAEIEPNFKESQ